MSVRLPNWKPPGGFEDYSQDHERSKRRRMDVVGRPTVDFKTDLEKLFQRDISRALESLPVKLKEDQVKFMNN